MKKRIALLLVIVLCLSLLSTAAFAASAGWRHSGAGWWYQNADGSYPANCWKSIGGKWYHFDRNGYMQTGWIKSGSSWYYLKSSGVMATGWVRSGGSWYYMNGSGVMQTGWVRSGGSWYYMNGSGAMQTGWVKSGGSWYYMDENGAMVTGERTIGGKKYYFSSSGVWQQSGGDSAGWRKAYAEVLRTAVKELSTARFGLAYVDGDSIPELLISPGEYHVACSEVYTWYNGALVDLGLFGQFGSLLFAEGTGVIRADNFANGVGPHYHYNVIANGASKQVKWFMEDYRDGKFYIGNGDFSLDDSTRVSESYYNSKFNEWESAYSWTAFTYENAYPITDAAISGMQADFSRYLF